MIAEETNPIRGELLDLLTRLVPKGGLKFSDMEILRHEVDQSVETIQAYATTLVIDELESLHQAYRDTTGLAGNAYDPFSITLRDRIAQLTPSTDEADNE